MILFTAGTRKSLCFGIVFFQLFFLAAQAPDSIPVGVIQVKRPPVPATYLVGLTYLHRESRDKVVSDSPIIFSDSAKNPNAPRPKNFSLFAVPPHFGNDSVYLAVEFKDWKTYLSQMNYTFAWTDSTKSDSALYQYTIDKNGNAICKPIPWTNADSTCRKFEKESSVYAMRLTHWTPALQNKKPGSTKTKRVPCVVLVTIYAYDPNVGRLLPIESMTGH